MAVELGTVSLDHLTEIVVKEDAKVVMHAVPGLAGHLVQHLGRSSVRLSLRGAFIGANAAEHLATLRAAYVAGDPLDLLADAVGEGYVAQVVLDGLEVVQHASEPDGYDYRIRLVEYVQLPMPASLGPLAEIDV